MFKGKNRSVPLKCRKRSPLKYLWVIFIGLALTTGMGTLGAVHASTANTVKEANKKAIIQKAFKLQMPFIANHGQITDERVRFYAKTFGGTAYVTETGEIVYSMRFSPKSRGCVLKESLVGASRLSPQGMDRAQTKVNYFIGNNRSKWKTKIPTYNSVSLGQVYEGVNLSLRAFGKTVEKIFTLNPGADPKSIKLKMQGAKSLQLNDKGELEVETEVDVVRFSKPLAYQEKSGKKETVRVTYRLDKDTYGFVPGDYDKSYPLIIDPILSYSTYLGGSDDEIARGIAVDSSGNVYVTGSTLSDQGDTDPFPTVNAYQGVDKGGGDAFVAKIDPSKAGTASLVYSTYLGGMDYNDSGWGIAVDSSNNIYVLGETASTDFPTTGNAFQQVYAGGFFDAFITKLSADGSSLLFSTYLGGSGWEEARDIAIDTAGNACVTGSTQSTDFPLKNAYQSGNASGGPTDAFVTKIDPSQSGANSLIYSTYLGGSSGDFASGIAVDTSGDIYVIGDTYSTDFPTKNPYQSSNAGRYDVFVTKIDPSQSGANSLIYSTYLGGSNTASGIDTAWGIAVDTSGNIYVAGYTDSWDDPAGTPFPTTANAYQVSNAGGYDAFITKLSADGSSLIYSTYLGGTGLFDFALDIAVDTSGNVHVVGYTDSTDFPTLNALQSNNAGSYDAFVTKIDPSQTGSASLIYSTYLGGEENDHGFGISLDGAGNANVTGYTHSDYFPTTGSSYRPAKVGASDAFVAKLTVDTTAPWTSKYNPIDGKGDVAVDTTIVLHVEDDLSGVDESTIVMEVKVDGNLVNGSLDVSEDDPKKGPLDKTLTYTPASNLPNSKTLVVTVDASDLAGNAMASTQSSFTTVASGTPTPPPPQPNQTDTDKDGIYDWEEAILNTDPQKKTLFVRPIRRKSGQSDTYWEKFVELFPFPSDTSDPLYVPPAEQAGRVFIKPYIKAFAQVGQALEIVVIGHDNNPYLPMRGHNPGVVDGFDYDPATDVFYPSDPNLRPHCDIMEVVYHDDTSLPPGLFTNINKGYTFFDSQRNTWSWDCKGYTESALSSFGYHVCHVYSFALHNYFNHGAYPTVEAMSTPTPDSSHPCSSGQCWALDLVSPMNLCDTDTGPPYTCHAEDESPDIEQMTVEFNPITYDTSTKEIQTVAVSNAHYKWDDVLRRTTAHEMGHGLLSADKQTDHCTISTCIMNAHVDPDPFADQTYKGWELHDFGPAACSQHKPGSGGSQDITVDGVIHNQYYLSNLP